MMNKTNKELVMMELDDDVLENVIGGIGARPPKRRDNFMINYLAKFIYWLTEGRFKQDAEVASYDEEYEQ